MFKLYRGDCLAESKSLASGSVDLILTDPPYGNMNTDGGRKLGISGWDFTIDPVEIHNTANNLLRKNGKMVLFSQEPYTSKLIREAIPGVPFNYRAVWKKDNFAVALGVNKNMVSFTEDILIFSKVNPVHDFEASHPLRPYFKKVFEHIGLTKKSVISAIGQRVDHVLRFNSSQFALCTQEVYSELIRLYGIDMMDDFKIFDELLKVDHPFRKELCTHTAEAFPAVFNLWEGSKYKSNILTYKKDYDGHHPTQKPVLLLEDLIKTFSNEGDTVLDLTMGSGSTGVACMNTNRKFIGIEKDEAYFKIAKKRISDAYNLF